MAQATILVVEDESIVAMDLQHRLSDMGYSVPAVAISSSDALVKAAVNQPDLALMDIRLNGHTDGIEVAGMLRQMLGVPSVYLTAYADSATLTRAKTTEPLGYLVKPIVDDQLRSTVEIALRRRDREREMKQSDACLKAVSSCMSEGLVAADHDTGVMLMNPAAETMTGWTRDEALTRDISDVLPIATNGATHPHPAKVVYETCTQVPLTENLVVRSEEHVPIRGNAAPILDDLGHVTGVVVAFKRVRSPKDSQE